MSQFTFFGIVYPFTTIVALIIVTILTCYLHTKDKSDSCTAIGVLWIWLCESSFIFTIVIVILFLLEELL
jgi:hypothetical protein